jgi:hypothetical protein
VLILDTDGQARWAREGQTETTKSQRVAALAKEIQSNTISVRDDAGRDTSSVLAQMGRPLASDEVQRRLRLCNPQLIFERSNNFPELTGVYIEKDERTEAGAWAKRKIHLFGMESGYMPEFSVLHQTVTRVPNPEVVQGGGATVDRDAVKWIEVPTFLSETRGWRTVLIRLLHLGLITRGQVEQHFGWSPSQDSQRWAEMTR